MGPLVIALRRDALATLLRLANTDVRRGEMGACSIRTAIASRIALADGSTDTGDLLIGADGVGSIVRRRLRPEEDRARRERLFDREGRRLRRERCDRRTRCHRIFRSWR